MSRARYALAAAAAVAVSGTALVVRTPPAGPGDARRMLTATAALDEAEEHEPSGAKAALDLWTAQRAYPARAIPDVARAAAFERERRVRSSGPIDASVSPWTSLGPENIGGRTLALAARFDDPDVIFAGSASGGLWKSTVGGVGADAWDRVSTGFSESAVGAIELDPQDEDVMYVGTGEVYRYQGSIGGEGIRTTRGSYGIGILKSTDGGVTWAKSLDWTLAQTRGVQAVEVDPTSSQIVWAATTEGVYRSTDAGTTWTNVHPVVMAEDLVIDPANPSRVLATHGNLGSPGTGLYRTTNAGATWAKVTSGLPSSWSGKAMLGLAEIAPDIVYASIGDSVSGRGLWKSSDFGASWFQVNSTDFQQHQGFYSHYVLVDPTDADHVYAAGIEIWESNNGGSTLFQRSQWTQVFLGVSPPQGPIGGAQYAHADHHAAIWHPQGLDVTFFASDGGVFKSTDGGSTFQSLIGGLVTTQLYNGWSQSGSSANLAMGGFQDNFPNLYEGTTSWRRVIGGDGTWTAIDPNDDQIMVACYQYLGMLRSVNGGFNWTTITPPQAGNDVTAFCAPVLMGQTDSQVLYGGRSRIYKSFDRGTSWTAMNGGNQLDPGNPALSMAMPATSTDTLYVGTAPVAGRARVFRTTNGGVSFTDVTGTLPDRYPMDVTLDPTDSRKVYVVLSGFGTSHLFGSTNGGATWTDLGAGLPDVPTTAVEVDPDHPQVLYVGNDLGAYVSPDGGSTWQTFAAGMPTALVNDLKVFAPTRKLRAATHGNGAWERDLFDPTGTDAPVVAAAGGSRLALSVGPNPASGPARIRFDLPETADVRIDVVDVAGRRVLNVPRERRAAGPHDVALDLGQLAPGVYFVRVEAGPRRETARVVTVR
jgi:hypothetical protein